MRNKTISISSESSDEDNVPLKTVKSNQCTGHQNAYESLLEKNSQACEFCDRISINRYSSLIHNISHIIIPLINQTVFQCPTCLHSFASQNELRKHNVRKHPEVLEVQGPLINDSCSVKKFHTHTSRDEPNIITIGTKKNETTVESIKNRLIFEDDDIIFLDCDQLLNDLTTDCKVNLEVFETPWMNGVSEDFSGKSVHYDELVKPGVYRCKKCGKGFPVRYDAIVHESSHMTIKNSQVSLCVICKKYLVGGRNDLRHHYVTFHKEIIEKSHLQDTEYYKLLFEENNEDKKSFDSKILNLCDMCLSFCRNTSSKTYECIGTVNKLGKRFECEKCGQMFFEINIVKRSLQRRALYGTHSQKKRKMTNEDRLKTIASRFKMMKH